MNGTIADRKWTGSEPETDRKLLKTAGTRTKWYNASNSGKTEPEQILISTADSESSWNSVRTLSCFSRFIDRRKTFFVGNTHDGGSFLAVSYHAARHRNKRLFFDFRGSANRSAILTSFLPVCNMFRLFFARFRHENLTKGCLAAVFPKRVVEPPRALSPRDSQQLFIAQLKRHIVRPEQQVVAAAMLPCIKAAPLFFFTTQQKKNLASIFFSLE